jgi:hypothetical protein
MKPWRCALLIFELALFAVILILPQVDLPDFTFHGRTAPVVAKTRLSPVPVWPALAILVQISLPDRVLGTHSATSEPAAPLSSGFRLSLLCTLLC